MIIHMRARVRPQPGMLARLAAVLNPYPVEGFDYQVAPDRSAAMLEVRVAGSDWHVQRVAARLERVVGVTSVDWDTDQLLPAGSLGTCVLPGLPVETSHDSALSRAIPVS